MESTICARFLKVLAGSRNVCVVQVGVSLASQVSTISSQDSEVVSTGHAPEVMFLEEDVMVFCEMPTPGSHKWEEISVSIGIPEHTIEESRNARSNNLKLYRSLKEWICRKHENTRQPTMRQIKRTLNSLFVGLPDLALKVEIAWKVKMDLEDSNFTVSLSESNKVVNITLEPSDNIVTDGKSTLLEVQVSHSECVCYKWMKDDWPLPESLSFTGTRSSMLLIHKASQGVQGKYCCHVNIGSVQLLTTPVQVTITFPPEKQCLLNLYSSLKEVHQDTWPMVAPNTFVDVALIDIMQESKPNLVKDELDDILETKSRSILSLLKAFSHYEEGALIILEGRPGSGKTTLTCKITKDWVNGKTLKNANKVFLLSLRKDYDRFELFKSFYQTKARVHIDQIEDADGKETCFILDGYDEFSNSHGDQSVIHQLIHKRYLPLAMVILTSRPVATASLRPKATRRYEILGFSKKCFHEFVDLYPFQNNFDERQAKVQLKDFLKTCSNVLNLCYLPCNASMICFLIDHIGEVKNTLKTETEIYKLFILAVALRKLRNVHSIEQLQSLEDLPDSDKDIFEQLCLLAFTMTVECDQIIKLPLPVESLNSSSLRGLLTIDSTIRLTGLEDTVVFLHLTLQEYLAAHHLASLDEDQQAKMIRIHSGKCHMLTTFKFYCGLVDFQNKLQQFDDIVRLRPNMLYVFHCVYETQLECVCHRAMELLDGKIDLESGVLTPADFNVLAYVITNASLLVKELDIQPCLLYEEFVEDKWKNKEINHAEVLSSSFWSSVSNHNVRSAVEYDLCTQLSYYNKGQFNKGNKLQRLAFLTYTKSYLLFQSSSDLLSSDSAISLVDALKYCNKLDVVRLVGNFSSTTSARILSEVLRNSLNLKEFILYGYMSSSEMKLLAQSFHRCKSLQKLDLLGTDLRSSLKEISNILIQCSNMRELYLKRCNVSSEGAYILARGLSTTSLDVLYLSSNDIGPNGIKLIADNTLCKELFIVDCNVGPEGVMHLAHCLLLKPVFTSLSLVNNRIDSKSTIALAEGLSHCCYLQELLLSYNNVGYDGAVALAQCLKSCDNLRKLHLSSCSLQGDGIAALAEQFYLWNHMKVLNFSRNGVISDGHIVLIANGIQQLYFLQELYLSDCGMDNEAAIALAEGIQSCPLLHTLDVSSNRIGSDGACVLAQSMKCEENEYLDFSHNTLDDICIDSLVALVLTSQLQKLDLSHNNIGPTGSKCIVSELLDCPFRVEVNLTCNNVFPEDMRFITQLIQRNVYLHVLLE